jgi:hypothetical protein
MMELMSIGHQKNLEISPTPKIPLPLKKLLKQSANIQISQEHIKKRKVADEAKRKRNIPRIKKPQDEG